MQRDQAACCETGQSVVCWQAALVAAVELTFCADA
jgi:hypothetical protein